MRALLNQIFLRKLGLGKFFLSAFAFLVGFTLVLMALQAYVKIKEFITPQKNTSNYIIINKEVALAHTLLGGKAQFSEAEIDDLKQQPFVADLGVFKSNNFAARAYLGGNLGFETELFFESVPAQFIDNVPYDFKWEKGSDFLPLIISQDFLNLYNFGYALGRGTPQLSKSTIELVPLKVEIYGPLGRRAFNAKVVGFSERISSILVPNEFLSWANVEIGDRDDQPASRAIIKIKSDKAQSLDQYLEKNNLKINDEKIKFNKIMTTMNVVMSVLVFVGIGFMLFSLVIVMLNFSLMVAQAKEEVSLLLQLGYKAKHLVGHLSIYLFVFLATVSLLSSIVFIAGNHQLTIFLVANGVDVTKTIAPEVIFLGIGFIAISVLVSYYSIKRLIRKQL
jgi:ABC-type antimicrobial peptide transport system permease subunit